MTVRYDPFGSDYYERGVESGLSNYTDFRWLPEVTRPMVAAILAHCGVTIPAGNGQTVPRVLDFGCAKGYVVRALRERGYDAWGCDVSRYAIQSCDDVVSKYLRRSVDTDPVPFSGPFDLVIAKDVFEHIPRERLPAVLADIKRVLKRTGRIFVAVPLAYAAGGAYVLPESELDTTHIIRETIDGWAAIFAECGLWVIDSRHRVPGIGDKHTADLACVGFFLLGLPLSPDAAPPPMAVP